MKISRGAWAAIVVVILAVALLAYWQQRGGHLPGAKPHSVVLHWNPTDGATAYHVYRSDGRPANFRQVGTATEPSYVDTAVPGGTVLFYAVTAVSDDHESPFSNQTRVEVP
jgi:fibronectin type 3 domain-containing protein